MTNFDKKERMTSVWRGKINCVVAPIGFDMADCNCT